MMGTGTSHRGEPGTRPRTASSVRPPDRLQEHRVVRQGLWVRAARRQDRDVARVRPDPHQGGVRPGDEVRVVVDGSHLVVVEAVSAVEAAAADAKDYVAGHEPLLRAPRRASKYS